MRRNLDNSKTIYTKEGEFTIPGSLPASYSGTDIALFAMLPYGGRSYVSKQLAATGRKPFKKFAEVQTLSISSTRSVHPVRVLGRSNALTYTRGARSWAGTMVLASLDKDALLDMYVPYLGEGAINNSSFSIDQIPPFSMVVAASNEKGDYALQFMKGITLVNYGTTYSVDDLYTETTYTYVATDVSPFIKSRLHDAQNLIAKYLFNEASYQSVSSVSINKREGRPSVEHEMTTDDEYLARVRKDLNTLGLNPDLGSDMLTEGNQAIDQYFRARYPGLTDIR